MEITATVKRIEETKTVGQNDFKTRNLVVTTEEQYPQVLSFQFVKDKTSILDKFTANQTVKITFNLKGREHTNQKNELVVYNTLDAWKIESV